MNRPLPHTDPVALPDASSISDSQPASGEVASNKKEQEVRDTSLIGSIEDALANSVVIDVETTGLDPQHERIIEIAALHIRKGKPSGSFHALVNPGRPLSSFIQNFTGLDDAAVEAAEDVATVLEELREFLREATEGKEAVLVGHNVSFDVSFLQAEARRHALTSWDFLGTAACTCTAKASRALIERETVGRYRLERVAEHLGTEHKPSHRALDDVYATYEVLTGLRGLAAERKL